MGVSGQDKAKENIELLERWLAEREVARDWTDYIRGHQLNKSEIAKECGFARSSSVLQYLQGELRRVFFATQEGWRAPFNS